MALQTHSTHARATADAARWSHPEISEPARDERAQFAAQFIPAGARVLELNCGRMALRRYLPHGCQYQGSDLIARDDDTVVCDLNAGEFPTKEAAQADVIVMLGVLETIVDVETFFTHLRFCKRDVILTYCATDLTGACDRAALGWINHFSYFDLARLFDRFGFRIECTAPLDSAQALMRLTPTERLAPLAPCSVAVVSDGASSFGGRLGLHMINALLPGEAEVHHLTFGTLGEARAQYDLIVLGTGNSLFQPLLGDDLIDIIGRAKASIGIFGTQYRELMPRAGLERLIGRLDTWFTRYQDDVLMYGRGRPNVEYLGDWLIDLFPLVTSTDDEQLRIGAGDELPPDAAIDTIQRHKQVYAAAPQPLLCALTSAELAAYAEPGSPEVRGAIAGNFRSMLIDIFGRSYPERDFFLVDRDAVRRYKARVHDNVAAVRRRIDGLLRDVAVAAG
jgi:Methyltransferase domain